MLGGLPDHGEEAVDFRLSETGSGVSKAEQRLSVFLREDQADLIFAARLQLTLCGDRIDGILQQLAHKDIGGAVEMIRENVDHSAEIDLKHKIFLRHMFRLLDFDDLICALYHILPQKATVSR